MAVTPLWHKLELDALHIHRQSVFPAGHPKIHGLQRPLTFRVGELSETGQPLCVPFVLPPTHYTKDKITLAFTDPRVIQFWIRLDSALKHAAADTLKLLGYEYISLLRPPTDKSFDGHTLPAKPWYTVNVRADGMQIYVLHNGQYREGTRQDIKPYSKVLPILNLRAVWVEAFKIGGLLRCPSLLVWSPYRAKIDDFELAVPAFKLHE